jgi:hypothetical protein
MMPMLRKDVYPKPIPGTPLRDGIPFRLMAGICSIADRLELAINKLDAEHGRKPYAPVAETNPDATQVP